MTSCSTIKMILDALYTTLAVSVLASVIATIAGTFAAIGFYNMRKRWRTPLMTVNNIPMVNAEIVTGVSLCLFFVAFFNLWGDFAHWANEAVRAPAAGAAVPGLRHHADRPHHLQHPLCDPVHHAEAAPDGQEPDGRSPGPGCTWMQAFWKVVVPEIKPGIINGLLIAFTMSVDDFVISYFTAATSTANLAMRIYAMTKKRISPEVNAVSTLLFITVLILLVIINVREARQERAAAKQRLS